MLNEGFDLFWGGGLREGGVAGLNVVWRGWAGGGGGKGHVCDVGNGECRLGSEVICGGWA